MQSNNTPKQIISQHIDKSSFWSVDGEVIYQIARCVLPLEAECSCLNRCPSLCGDHLPWMFVSQRSGRGEEICGALIFLGAQAGA